MVVYKLFISLICKSKEKYGTYSLSLCSNRVYKELPSAKRKTTNNSTCKLKKHDLKLFTMSERDKFMSNNITPFELTHPGEVVKEELEYRGISQKHFAEITGVSYAMLNDILNGKRPISTDFALTLEAATGISAEILVNMQTRYNLQVARSKKENIKRWENLRENCASLL